MHTPDREINPPSFYKEEEAITDNRPKAEIEIQSTKVEIININLPYYCRYNHFAYRINENKELIQIEVGESISYTKSIQHAFLFFDRKDWRQIEELEFNELFMETLKNLEK